jgi:hypothetical protein
MRWQSSLTEDLLCAAVANDCQGTIRSQPTCSNAHTAAASISAQAASCVHFTVEAAGRWLPTVTSRWYDACHAGSLAIMVFTGLWICCADMALHMV